jgi:hypothetical protein
LARVSLSDGGVPRVVGAVLEEDAMAATEDDGYEMASREARV